MCHYMRVSSVVLSRRMWLLWIFLFMFGLCTLCLVVSFFFFSSRRRHTRCLSDWSSDVCSSDLSVRRPLVALRLGPGDAPERDERPPHAARQAERLPFDRARRDRALHRRRRRSEERRVGKECTCRWAT